MTHMKPTIIEQPSQPLLVQAPLAQMGSAGMLLAGGSLGFVFLLILGIVAYTSVYKITPNNEAFVRTGGVFIKQKRVFLNGGCIVIPGFHEITRVPLREISIDVERTGNLAVRTQDYLRANMRVTFYVCVSADKQDVLTVAARLSKEGKISATDIKEALEKRADDAIRAAAKKKSLAEIDSDKLGFADEVLNLIQQDLKKVGLTLNNIAISEIEESDTYDENNFFDAQGVRLRTETIQKSIQQKREVELKTKVLIEQRELDAEKQSLRIAKEKEEANLDQKLEVESMTAQREREIQESKDQELAKIERNKLLQNKSVEEEKIQQELAVQQSQIDANIALEERNKQLKIAQALQKQESEVAEINRQQMVESSQLKAQIEIAAAERESKIAQQEAAIAIVEKERERLAADAERAQAEAAVITAQEIEQAEREQRLTAIEAEKEAQKQRISEQNVVEIDVFRRRRQAEIARQAAELEAESIRTLAQANRDRALAEAQGEQALIEAKNALSDAKLSAQLISEIWPALAPHIPEIVKGLTPQPGILGDTRIYSFPGANGNNGNGMGDINKLLMSTSGLSLVNALMDEGKLGALLQQISQMVRNPNPPEADSSNAQPKPEASSPAPGSEKPAKAIAPPKRQPMKPPSAPENPTAS
ncbi:MAG: flotillin family protein [Roseofilum sp. SBFL]|nr:MULTISPECIES: SPFH domain-containing protein [unclassified Roseofilum]MBP0023462.1 flotillin family protein [Roseofilum sp. SID2]MBP0009278.1 flotillin family protein [Roseofilum sp. Belize Diploria]MBP0013698.1 flotillin family protein [Roseofilum sp. SID3]MBP0037230.1 flotillin family protein [Roseofilum sp. SID1]MBP0040927.1 flotillin family protein [Roseofilum sp. SBFL]